MADRKEKRIDSAFEDEGIFDDKCATCARYCCCAPPPFRVALGPVIFLLAVFIALYCIMYFDATTLCASSPERDTIAPCVPHNVTVNGVEYEKGCPLNPHVCDYVAIAKISVEMWSLFFIIIIAGFAIIRAIISIFWWIFRAISGKHGLIWAYLKPLDTPVHWLIWNFLFFICYNRFLFYAESLVYDVCTALSLVIVIVCVVYILAALIVTFVARRMSKSARKTEARFRARAKLVDKLLREQKSSLVDSLSFGLLKIGSKGAKNLKKTAKAASQGDDVVVDMKEMNENGDVSEATLADVFARIDTKNRGFLDFDDVATYAGVSGVFAKDLWAIFSDDKRGTIYLPEFIFGIRSVERGLKETISELKNREFLAKIIGMLLRVLFGIIGVIIALDAIKLQLAVLLTALSVMMVAAGMILAGVFGKILTAFLFLLTTKAYYEGDVAVIGGDPVRVTRITLLNTYGFRPDGKWVVYSNADIAGTCITNLTRSLDCVFVFDAVVSPSTSEKQIADWRAAIEGYVASKPENWKGIGFNITGLDGVDNKMIITMAAQLRGANWSSGAVFLPVRSQLFNYIRLAAAQLGISYVRSTQPTTSVALPAAAELETVDLNMGPKEAKDSKDKEKGKKKESKKDK